MCNANVLRAIEIMEQNLVKLLTSNVEETENIRKDAVDCDGLMQYSHLVADTNSDEWKRLTTLVSRVLVRSLDRMSALETP